MWEPEGSEEGPQQPIYDGFTVLDSSKSRVYDFHYKAIQPECRDNIELLMTDGDRLIYERKPDDWYQDMYHMREDDPPT